MGGVIARAPRIDGRRAGAEGAAGKPMPGNAVPRLQLPGGFAPTEHHWALTRGAGPMTNGLRAGSWRGALTRGAGPMTNGSGPGSVAGCSRVEAVR